MTDIQTFERALPHGITLSCRAAGEPGRPLMLFLHGFPEAAFIWDPLLAHFARPENGGYRCVAPNLRGFERSSAPAEVEAYQAHRLMQDLRALAESESAGGHIDTLIAHDWGGAFGWGMANAMPERVGRLVIINSPHVGTFARELKNSPEQQEASAYMNWLARPGSEEVLARDDFARLFGMLSSMHAGAGNADWLTDDVKARYREVWSQGLVGACNLYRVTPLKPGNAIPEIPRERVTVDIPTLVLWGMADIALRPGLLDGLEDYVPQLEIERLEGATHWVVHEQPELVMARIGAFIRRHPRPRG